MAEQVPLNEILAELQELEQGTTETIFEEIKPVPLFAYDRLLNWDVIRQWVRQVEPGPMVYLPNHRLVFVDLDGRGGKRVATVVRTNRPGDRVWGVIWQVHPDEFPRLEQKMRVPDRFYTATRSVVDRGGRRKKVKVFILARRDLPTIEPRPDDLMPIVRGAHNRGLPHDYIRDLHHLIPD